MITMTNILHLLDPLRALGVLSDGDAEQILALSQQSATATALARGYVTIRDDAAAKAATALLAKGADITPDRLCKAALAVATVADVELISDHVERTATAQARALLLANTTNLPAILTSELDALTARAHALIGELRGIATATDAIDSDRVDQWRELTNLKGRYAELIRVVEQLRAHRVIPGPRRDAERGPQWQYRLTGDSAEFYAAIRADDNGLRLFKLSVDRRPWVPTAEQAAATAEAWNREAGAAA